MRLQSLKFLKTFQVAARLQSFKAAAAELCVTPSAISHQIKALEQQLGVSLFQRGVRTLTLTDAGARTTLGARAREAVLPLTPAAMTLQLVLLYRELLAAAHAAMPPARR